MPIRRTAFGSLWRYFFNNGTVPAVYEEKLAMLRKNHIALWDSIDSCVREGSLDSAICDEVANDFTVFLRQYPNIKRICFNGGKSFQCFKKYNKELLKNPQLEFYTLPSTSPANARFRLADLQEKWQEALRAHL